MIATNSDIVRMFGLPRETFDATLTLKLNEVPTWEIKAYAEVKKNKPSGSTFTETQQPSIAQSKKPT